jgi:Heparinase II/III-like protein/Heparinase II/III N-terminus
MRLVATLKEVLALGPKRSAKFGIIRARRKLARWLGPDRKRFQPLSDEEWESGVCGRDVAAAVEGFINGSADLGWFAVREPVTSVRHLRAHCPDHVELVLSEAGEILKGSVVLFTTPVSVVDSDGKIDWQRDWLGTHRWNVGRPSETIPIGREPGADPRVPWELGRSLHLLTLAQAYALSGQDRYARTAADHVLSFLAGNPPGMGIQWASTMEVALRAANWLAAWQFIRRSPAVAPAAPAILRGLVDHGRYIMTHLENQDGITSNHYLADLATLACLGRLEPLWPAATAWVDYWTAQLPGEIEAQVLEDGFVFEASVSYHRLSLELLAFPLVIPGMKQRLPPASLQQIGRMIDACQVYQTTGGLVPQFGDNDGGRMHLLHRRDPLDHSYLSMFRRIVDDDASVATPEAIWLFGPGRTPEPREARPTVQVLPNAGIVALRDDDVELMFTCGPNGQGDRGGHAHNDKASWVLFLDGEEVVVDPGTFEYTRDIPLRQWFRSTGVHSTLELAGAEQNRFSYLSGFRLIPDAAALLPVIRTRGNRVSVCAGHTGYQRSPIRLRHRRRIAHTDGTPSWRVLDIIAPPGDGIANPVSIVYSLPLAPTVKVEQVGPASWRLRVNEERKLTGTLRTRGIAGEWKAEDGWLSRCYGERSPTVFLRFRGRMLPQVRRAALLLSLEARDH